MKSENSPQPVLFLDRDGTLIREQNFLRDPNLVFLEEGVLQGLKLFHESGYRLVVVTNQSGLSRGLITPNEFQAVNERLSILLASEDIFISSWHHCPHLPSQHCDCRKPATGMFHAANAMCPVNWSRSVMVGDKPSDVEAGLALGLLAALVTTGYGEQHADWARVRGFLVVESIMDLASRVLSI